MTGFNRCKAVFEKTGDQCDLEQGHDGPHRIGVVYSYYTWVDEPECNTDEKLVAVMVLVAGQHYPPIPRTDNKKRYAGEGDVLFLPEGIIDDYVDKGFVRRYSR